MNKKLNWNVQSGGLLYPDLDTRPVTDKEYLTTFRSGARYQAEINGGATPLAGDAVVARLGRALGDTGHNFDHRKVTMATSSPRIDTSWGNPKFRYIGPALFVPPVARESPNYSNINNTLGFSSSELDVLGSMAISSAYPTKPQSDLLVAIAELLREGLPSALFSAVTTMRGNSKRDLVQNLASDYLNHLFGVTPIVREIDKLIKTVQKLDEHFSQLVTDSGRLVRRARVVQKKRTDSPFYTGSALPTVFIAGSGTARIAETYTKYTSYQTSFTDVWFSGAFRYWIPDLLNSGSDFQSVRPGDYASTFEINQGILGLRATPKAAWNLLPFSWLVDWFVNVGAFFENADAMNHYGLVMPYGYVMAESKLVTTTTYDFPSNSGQKLGSISSSVTAIRQQRRRATPYGFGLKDVDFNPVQMSILAALGLSAGKR